MLAPSSSCAGQGSAPNKSLRAGLARLGTVLCAVLTASPALAIHSTHLNGVAHVSSMQGVYQEYTDVASASLAGVRQVDSLANDALASGNLDALAGSFSLSSHACSGGAVGAFGSAGAGANGGVQLAYIVSSSNLPPGTPVEVQVRWAVRGRVTAVGTELRNVQDGAQGTLSAQVALSVNDVSIVNRTGGYSRSISTFDGVQVIRSGSLNPLDDSDTQTVMTAVGDRLTIVMDASISGGSFAFGPASTDGDVQCSMVWGMDSLTPSAQVVLMEDPSRLCPPPSNGTPEHAEELLPPRPEGADPCITINDPPQPQHGCDGVAGFSVGASGPGTLTYSWQIETSPGEWVTLGNDPLSIMCAGGNGIAFATPANSANVTIRVRGCRGHYRVRVIIGGNCGEQVGEPVELTLCPADFNCDGSANSQDFFDFVSAFFAGAADFNHDGFTNSQDFFDFVARFFEGC